MQSVAMRAFQLLPFLLPFVFADDVPAADTTTDPPAPEGLLDFAKVNKCVMGVYGFDYNGYGCYCGLGGSGTPIDGIDECCQIHDACYEKANKEKCFKLSLYLRPYSFKCENKVAICSPKNSECQSALCQCDVAVAECWKKFPIPSKKLKCIKKN